MKRKSFNMYHIVIDDKNFKNFAIILLSQRKINGGKIKINALTMGSMQKKNKKKTIY